MEIWVSIGGAVISAAGLGIAIYMAWAAKTAAESAREASHQTRDDIRRILDVRDVERAIALVETLKTLQRDARWDTCLVLYPILRAMLSDIGSRYEGDVEDVETFIDESRTALVAIEDAVARSVHDSIKTQVAQNMTEILNRIQARLQEIASSMQFN